MVLPAGTGKDLFPKLLISIAVSAVILALLIRFTLSSADTSVWPSLLSVISQFSFSFIVVYIVLSITRTILQTRRYSLLIAATEETPPPIFHLFLVTLSRNMFVDMLPARLGELSYIAMLNRGHRISGQACISSLAMSFVFDLMALGFLILLLLCAQIVAGDMQGWLAGVLIMLFLVISFLLALCYPVLKIFNRFLSTRSFTKNGFAAKLHQLLKNIEDAFQLTIQARITTRIITISFGIRVLKYFSLFCLFIGVVKTQFPHMPTDITMVLPALISAEAGASLPIPTFLGLGTYEAGGSMALIALGASKSTSLIVMLSMHVISQIVDYLLGAFGFVLFIFKTGQRHKTKNSTPVKRRWIRLAIIIILLLTATAFLFFQIRAISKRGAVSPPDPGSAVAPAAFKGNLVSDLNGFIVWSSNRSGNHDIYLYSMPDKKTKQLTSHSHTEYFPRISPDGKRIVFARSQVPWVSQRNYLAWDIWLLDLETGKERLLAKNGNVPTWSADGKSIYFQRNGNEVIQLSLKKMQERSVHKSGSSIKIPAETILETPSLNKNGKYLAVTFRKSVRATAVVNQKGGVRKLGQGCQLTWGPKDHYLYKIDHGGKMQNAIYRLDPKTGDQTKWFDAVGDYSHEYFPRISANGKLLVYGASRGDHTHDTADYEIFLWKTDQPANQAVRLTYHTGNDCWPDIYLR